MRAVTVRVVHSGFFDRSSRSKGEIGEEGGNEVTLISFLSPDFVIEWIDDQMSRCIIKLYEICSGKMLPRLAFRCQVWVYCLLLSELMFLVIIGLIKLAFCLSVE